MHAIDIWERDIQKENRLLPTNVLFHLDPIVKIRILYISFEIYDHCMPPLKVR